MGNCCIKTKGKLYPTLNRVVIEQNYIDCFNHFEPISKAERTTAQASIVMVELYNLVYDDNKSPHAKRHLDYVFRTLSLELGRYINSGRKCPQELKNEPEVEDKIEQEEIDEIDELDIVNYYDALKTCLTYQEFVKHIKDVEFLSYADARKKASLIWKKKENFD